VKVSKAGNKEVIEEFERTSARARARGIPRF